MRIIPKVMVGGVDMVGRKTAAAVCLKICDGVTANNLLSESKDVIFTASANRIRVMGLILGHGQLLSPARFIPSFIVRIDNTEDYVGAERIEGEECAGDRCAVTSDTDDFVYWASPGGIF